ncbi:MAG: hypothetical protein LWW85_08985, partial [Marinilabiliales bacterium]|nr:hypothetical protein [Marinilabiliales bacterium]
MNPIHKSVRGGPGTAQPRCCPKLTVYNWLHDVPNTINPNDVIEVRFKNTRKDYFRNVNEIQLKPGDIVAVEANPGHD